MDYGFEVSDAVLGELAKVGFDPVYGARPLKRAIQSEIENPLAKAILEGRFAPKDSIRVDWRGGRMVFEKTPRRAAAEDELFASQLLPRHVVGAGAGAPRTARP